MKIKYLIGIDISKEFFDVAGRSGATGPFKQAHFENTLSGFEKMRQWLPAGSWCLMEATGPYYVNLACWLVAHGYQVSVLNPLVVRRFAQMKLMRTKTDPADARLIAMYGEEQHPQLWQARKPLLLEMRQILSLRELLVRIQTMLTNQKQSFADSGKVDEWVARSQQELLDNLKRRIQQGTQRLVRLARKQHEQTLERIMSIPGVGIQTAVTLLVITNGFTRFSNPKKLAAFCGLSPCIWISGTSIKGRGSISKTGTGRIRQLLYMASWTGRRCNPGCKELYERLEEKKKPKKVISIAIAHKLLPQIWAVGHSDGYFDPKLV